MTREQKRILIAEACGWTFHPPPYHKPPYSDAFKSEALLCWVKPGNDDWQQEAPPNYFGSLDAMHEAEKVLTDAQWWDWEKIAAKLAKFRGITPLTIWIAQMSAEQRAEAFGLALRLWKEGQ